MTLQECIAKARPTTEKLEEGTLTLPKPSFQWERKLEALEEANLWKQRQVAIFDMRCEQAEILGFQHVDSFEMVEMLMGQPHTNTEEVGERQKYEWVYNHHTDKDITSDGWGGKPMDYFRMERTGLWFWPPFSKTEIWRCRLGKLNYLKREIPYGVNLKIIELKKLKLFNCFNIFAPIEAWENKTDIDPILVATIWQVTSNKDENNHYNTAGSSAHFFVAQW